MTSRSLAAALGLLAACSFSGPGSSGEPGAAVDGGADQPDASEVGVDGAEAACAPLPDGAVAWWDGEALGVDLLQNFPMSDTFDDPTVEPGLVGKAMTLEEDEDIIFEPAPQPSSFTVEGWIRRQKDDTDWMTVYGNGDEAGVFLYDHKLTYYDSDVDGDDPAVSGATTIALDTYTHIAVTFDGAVVTLYVDGVQDGAGGASVNLPGTGRVGGVLFGVGDGDGNDFVGQVDELTIYDRPLTSGQIAAIAAAGALGKCKP